MSILNEDINITLGTVGENCVSVAPRINNKLESFQLRKIFGLPMYDQWRLERTDEHIEISHDGLQKMAHQALINVFTEMPVELLTGPGIISELAMHNINIDGIMMTSLAMRWSDDPRSSYRTTINFGLYKLNKRGQYKKVANVAIEDHFAHYEFWVGVAQMWAGYPRNGGQFRGRNKWGQIIYQVPKADRQTAYIP